MSDSAIKIENLCKVYRIGAFRKKHNQLREAVVDAVLTRFRRIGRGPLDDTKTALWALKDVSLEVKKGEILGIIGRNGAGKSTLLKILSRITEPTKGRVEMRGRVGSLLEVGTGFHPELTGRENIILNGAILGMTRNEIRKKFDEIVAFSEIEKFIDTPVKHYSSGMYVRLAFAVAAHLEPEILLVDEVLAVGDASFQKKCMGKMNDVTKEGRTVLFVSHNMGAIRGLCPRVLCFNDGEMILDGEAQDVVSKYISMVSEGFINVMADANDLVIIENAVLKNASGEKTNSFAPGSELIVDIHYNALKRIKSPYFWVGIGGQFGSLFGANMLLDGFRPDYIEGQDTISCIFKSIPLLPQNYTLKMGVRAEDGMTIICKSKEIGFFNVTGTMRDIGFTGELADAIAWNSAPMVIPYEWRLPDGKTHSAKISGTQINKEKNDELVG